MSAPGGRWEFGRRELEALLGAASEVEGECLWYVAWRGIRQNRASHGPRWAGSNIMGQAPAARRRGNWFPSANLKPGAQAI